MAMTSLFLIALSSAICTAATGLQAVQSGAGNVLPVGSALVGKSVVLNCLVNVSNATLDQPVEYEWLKEKEDGSYQLLHVTNISALYIESVARHEEGSYNCRKVAVSNGSKVELDRAHFTLTVLVPPDISIAQKTGSVQRYVTEGGALILTCHVTNSAKPSVPDGGYTWSFRRQKGHDTMTLKDKGQDLIIQPVYRNHSGWFSCKASNGISTLLGTVVPTSSLDIQVYYIDRLVTLLPAEWRTVVAGENITLTCQADSVPAANLTWLHQGRVLHTVESNEDVYSFTATGCQDSGEYQCSADNDFLKQSFLAQTRLTVTECAPALVKGSTSPPKVTVKFGDNVTLTVTVTADPAPSFLWSGPGLSSAAAQSPSLALYSLQPQQAGLYTVTVSNKHGSLNHTFVLEVTGKIDNDQKQDIPTSGGDLTTWLKVGGGALVALVCLVFACLMLLRMRRFCKRGTRKDSLRHSEHQYTGLYSADFQDSTGRRRSQEVGDYTSGGSSGHYMSIDSADLSWQPQAVQPQDSLSQVPEDRSYDVPPPPVSVTSPGEEVLRHPKPWADCEFIPMDDVSDFSFSLRQPDTEEGETVDEAPSLPQRCRRGSRESDQESEDSESYLACQVVSHGLPPSSLPSHSPTPQDIT